MNTNQIDPKLIMNDQETAEARQEAQRMSEKLNKSASFQQWWEDVGSGIRPLPGNDAEEHAKTVARSAWVACYAFFG